MRLLFIATICMAMGAGVAEAATSRPALNLDLQFAALTEPHLDGRVWGWTFYVREPIVVTDVAWYDEGGDGLSHAHKVGIWKDLGGLDTWPYMTSNYEQVIGEPHYLCITA